MILNNSFNLCLPDRKGHKGSEARPHDFKHLDEPWKLSPYIKYMENICLFA